MMVKYGIIYGLIVITYLILDGLWLGVVAKQEYTQSIGSIMREKFHIWPWFVFYLFHSFAILYLAVLPNLASPSLTPTLISAAILGAAAYGAYNLTCYAILEGWPLGITIKDWIWGTFATSASAVTAVFVFKKFIA